MLSSMLYHNVMYTYIYRERDIYIYIERDVYIYIYIHMCVSLSIHIYIYIYIGRQHVLPRRPERRGGQRPVSGPITGKRKRAARKADGKPTRLVNLGGSWRGKLTFWVTHFSYTHFSLPVSGPLMQGPTTRSHRPWGAIILMLLAAIFACMHACIFRVSGCVPCISFPC